MVEALLESPAVSAVGWSLVAFVWQGALIGAVTAVVLWAFRGRDPRWRYAAACLGLLVMTALPVRTAFRHLDTYTALPAPASVAPGGAATVTAGVPWQASPAAVPQARVSGTEASPAALPTVPGLQAWLPLLVFAWLAGVCLLSLRLAGGWLVVRRMARRGVPAGEELSRVVRRLARSIHVIPPVRTLESTLVDVPTVIGWLRPVVLIPAGAIAGLAPEQLEAVIAHELAHIRRYDYLVNLMQRVSETLFFYHPAVWWLSNRIRVERELCADDVAVAACGDATLYAEALRDLEQTRRRAALAMAATGGSLASRIARLLGQPPVRERWSPAGLAVTVVLIGLAAALGGGHRTVAANAVPEPAEIALRLASPPQETPLPPAREAVETEEANEQTGADPREVTPPELPGVEGPEVRLQIGKGGGDGGVGFTGGVTGIGGSFLGIDLPGVNKLALNGPVRVVAGQNVLVSPDSEGTAWMGVSVADGAEQGAVVRAVEAESPAAAAGIRTGDLITELDGTRVVGSRQFSRMVGETPAGRTVAVSIVRNGSPEIVNVTLAERAGTSFNSWEQGVTRYAELDEAFSELDETFRLRFDGNNLISANTLYFGRDTLRLGLRIENMTAELREFFGADPDTGVLVTSVEEDSAAAGAGVLVGDVIVAAGGNSVDSVADLSWSADIDDSVTLGIIRNRSEREVTVPLEIPPRSWRIAP